MDRRTLRRRVAGLALAAWFLCGGVHGQTLDEAFLALQTAMSAAADRARTAPSSMPDEQLGRVRSHINTLQARSGRLPQEERPLYARSLLHNADLLRLAEEEPDARKARSILDEVESDLKVKTATSDGLGLSSRFVGKVSVSVNTKRVDQTVGGYVIVLNPLLYAGDAPFARFDNVSSPAKGWVPPGRYQLTAFRERTPVCSEVVTIGLAAQESVALDIQVP